MSIQWWQQWELERCENVNTVVAAVGSREVCIKYQYSELERCDNVNTVVAAVITRHVRES